MHTSGKVLRRAGAALLAGLFIAATVADGQTFAAIQSEENHNDSQIFATDPTDNSYDFSDHATWDLTGNDLSASLPADSDLGDAELPSAPAPIVTTPLDQSAPYEPITARERLSWGIKSAIWPEHLVGGIITSAVGTGLDRPREDGPHWGGFAERYGVRLTGVATSNVMEAGFGALWAEDPRYFRVPELSYRGRVWNVVRMAFLARRRDGHYELAYARFIAFPGNNFLTNAWRPDSEANVHDAVLRSLGAFAGRIASNAWNEFWPQTKAYLFHRGGREP